MQIKDGTPCSQKTSNRHIMVDLAERSFGVWKMNLTMNLENLSQMIKYSVPLYSKLSCVSELHGDDGISAEMRHI